MNKFVATTLDLNHIGIKKGTLCIVISEDDEEYLIVPVSNSFLHNSNFVKKECFISITLEDYLTLFPDAEIDYEYIGMDDPRNKCEMKMGEPYIPSEDEMNELVEECENLLNEYDYNTYGEAIRELLNVYFENKGPLINVIKRHPNYNGKYQIAFDQTFDRNINFSAIFYYHTWLKGVSLRTLVEATIDGMSLSTAADRYRFSIISSEDYETIAKKFNDDPDISIIYGNSYTEKSAKQFREINLYAVIIDSIRTTFLTSTDAKTINLHFPAVKAVEGAKTSKVMNKIAKLLEIDKLPDYNREFSKYSDAINPLKIVRHTVLSLHPVDYLTMSFGNSWSSCHTIDKANRRGMPHSYEGCYSAGTMSYMLDESSMVYYTVSGDYNGDKLELQPKISRCMFHVGNDKIVQARMYPQSTDGETGAYTDTRNIVQRIISECFGLANFWSLEKGTEECRKAIETTGVHYRDYLSFDYCNVSYLKSNKCTKKIKVGHNPICPNCGSDHTSSENILCLDCRPERHCASCGDYIDNDEGHFIDGHWYCSSCSSYCCYHERRESISEYDMYYIDNYGHVCEDALRSGYFVYCEECGSYYVRDDDVITAIDGSEFCGEYCAARAGYIEYNEQWYPKYYFANCDICGCTFLEEELKDGVCKHCLESKESEVE